MKNISKSGLVLALLMASNAHAELIKVDLVGTVNSVYSYGTETVNEGDAANLSFIMDTSAALSNSYNYNGGYFSETFNYFSNAISSITGNFGNFAFSANNAIPTAYNYNETWGGYTYSGAGFYNNSDTYDGNHYTYDYFGLSRSGNDVINQQDLLASFTSTTNPFNFYLQNYSYDYNSGITSDFEFGATFNNISYSPVSASVAAVPVPAAIWLFGSALVGLVGMKKRSKIAPVLAA